MPLYEYQCKQCGKVFEVLQTLSSKPLTVHENCGGTLEKLVSPSALQFKGSGWYVTDYAKDSRGKAASPETAKDDHKGEKPKPAAEKTESTPAKPADSSASRSENPGGNPRGQG
jgi:putative FmdB family regulatory protein